MCMMWIGYTSGLAFHRSFDRCIRDCSGSKQSCSKLWICHQLTTMIKNNGKKANGIKNLKIAPAGNRTRVCTVAGYYSTTRPLVLCVIAFKYVLIMHSLIHADNFGIT
jgi:hypothetical protein